MLVDIILACATVYLVHYFLLRRYDRFKGTGVPFKAGVPLFGSGWKVFLGKVHPSGEVADVYRNYGDQNTRYIGFFNTIFPAIMIKDPELIKQLTIKEFDFFNEHMMTISTSIEPLFGRNLLSLRGQKWREMRATLSPAFTSSKMRDMFVLLRECGKQMLEYLLSKSNENNKALGTPQIELEMKDFSSRYMNDVIASLAFGIKVDSFKDSDNEFFTRGTMLSKITTINFIKISLANIWPKFTEALNIRMFPKEHGEFFKYIVTSAMKYREDNNVTRKDMIHLLMQAKKGSLKRDDTDLDKGTGFSIVEESEIGRQDVKTVWEDDDFVAQAMTFFFAGFDTASTLTQFILYEMALNTSIWKKLQEEVDRTIADCGRDITYEDLNSMKYLDMVTSEGLRKWPPLPVTDRVAAKDSNLGSIREGDNNTFTIRKGEAIWLPIREIQHDSRYWKNPEQFDPERFSDENKDTITPYTYLPFGLGPRNCIGSRFALMEVKTLIYYLMADFELELSDKTKLPLEFDLRSVPALKPKGGIWAKLTPRKK